eukprot:TRINITY_DN12264_c0_g1_i3.p1 TRINITY_DN12264_c0_g1~~TRINITY_DN12264_c0_g1_i3.p1  ORF type:complete len:530 (+),score=144.88 TRINITY_DN12264_c0_g1_i3:56-1591(+)
MTSLEDRYRGCVFGMACCDALGAAVEFQKRGTYAEVVDMRGGGKFDIIPGEWTDDTSTALCVAESLIYTGTFDPHDQMRRILAWSDKAHLASNGECFDIGKCTRKALFTWQTATDGGAAITDATPRFFGGTGELANGNGTLMRICPIPLAYRCAPAADAVRYAKEMSLTTHGGKCAVAACQVYTLMVRAALEGASKEAILCSAIEALPSESLPEPIREVVCGRTYATKGREDVTAGGYVVPALEAALWAFHRTATFESGALLCANLGEDTDTVAAIYGTLAGAYYGVHAIPPGWVEAVALRSLLEAYADGLLAFSRCFEAPVTQPVPSEGLLAFAAALEELEGATQGLIRRVRAGPAMFRAWEEYEAALKALTATHAKSAIPAALFRDFEKLWNRYRHNHKLDHIRATAPAVRRGVPPPPTAASAPPAGFLGAIGAGVQLRKTTPVVKNNLPDFTQTPPPPPPPPPPVAAAATPGPQASLMDQIAGGLKLRKTKTVEKNNLPDFTAKEEDA